jgi:hypothetical protein
MKAIILGTPNGQSPKRQVNVHNTTDVSEEQADPEPEEFSDAKETEDQEEDSGNDTLLINAAKSSNKLAPADVRRLMSTASKRSVNMSKCTYRYRVSAHKTTRNTPLCDRGANGGVAGNDVRVIHRTNRKVDVEGIDNHQVTDIDIGTVGGVTDSNKGPIIVVGHQYALYGKGSTIHSPAQMESYGLDVNDKSIHVSGGLQRITTPDGYVIPLKIVNGLPRFPSMRPFTDDEWEELPHVFLTRNKEWDPSIMDHDPTEDECWYDAIAQVEADPAVNLFDEFGEYRH